MLYYKVTCTNGYCGCDYEDFIQVNNYEEAIAVAEEMAAENAESFSYIHFGWDEPYTDEEWAEHMEQVDFNLEEITEERFYQEVEKYRNSF